MKIREVSEHCEPSPPKCHKTFWKGLLFHLTEIDFSSTERR